MSAEYNVVDTEYYFMFKTKDVDLLQKSKKRKKQKLRRIYYEFENYFISETKYIERVKCLFSVGYS